MADRSSESKPVPVRPETEIADDGTPVADRIRERILEAGERYHANDNICAYLEEGELDAERSSLKDRVPKPLFYTRIPCGIAAGTTPWGSQWEAARPFGQVRACMPRGATLH